LPQGAVRSVIVVVAFKLAQHGCGVLLVEDQEAVEEFTADCPDKALGDRIRPWCTNRRFDDLMSTAVKTASKAALNLASRSRMRNRKPRLASSRSMSRLRAYWVSQAPVGWAVTPRMCTRRVACSMTKTAYSRCRVIVSR